MQKTSRFLVLMILLSVVLTGCSQNNMGETANTTTDTPLEELAEAEVKEYAGEDLSSILDFRENSIKGTQHIDIDSYTLTVDGLVEKPAEYTYDQVLEHDLYKKVVTLYCVEGWSVDILWKAFFWKISLTT
jgi:DMSO/TMAO reductase YedYZ molybdopterin-dependent catalytic subunit